MQLHDNEDEPVVVGNNQHRSLKHGHHHHNEKKNHHQQYQQQSDDVDDDVNHDDIDDGKKLEEAMEDKYWDYKRDYDKHYQKHVRHHNRKKHLQRMKALQLANPIAQQTVHGIMIDAGSTGSRLHVYEWEPRVLWAPIMEHDDDNIDDDEATATTTTGRSSSYSKSSFPGTESQWTDRLSPGLDSFATLLKNNDIDDDTNSQTELVHAIAEYLQPLLDFAQSVLASKQAHWGDFPIFLRATAGMRMLTPHHRARILTAVRTVLHGGPFSFADDQASVMSGEEEAAYDWVGVNFLLNDHNLLLQDKSSEGTMGGSQKRTATSNKNNNPRSLTMHGALDLGGASTQISFFEPNEDIMSNLYKVQIGQAKHWNIYAHSFLFYGVNEAMERFQARLIANKSSEERLIRGVYNPCLPGGSKQEVRTNIHVSSSGAETLDYQQGLYPSGDGYFQGVLVNENKRGNAEKCMALARDLLHLEKNDWCDFAHKGDCSLAGIYQPKLPSAATTENFGEFLAFSNYFDIWQFLQLPERATLSQLNDATRTACTLSKAELIAFNHGRIDDESELESYCFRSAYAFELLHNGYGFQLNDTIRATQVINGQKVGWALGAMLYEINVMPWRYESIASATSNDFDHHHHQPYSSTLPRHLSFESIFLLSTALGMVVALLVVFVRRERKLRRMLYEYEPIKNVDTETF